MKKIVALVLLMTMIITGCSTGQDVSDNGNNNSSNDNSKTEDSKAVSNEKVTIDFMSNASDETLVVYKALAEEFSAENPNITVNVSSQGKDYESLMKANMAADELPDVFATHGWSVARYSDYLRPLNDQPWAEDIQSSMIPIISNDKDEFFVLPIDIDQTGIVFNKTLLDELGIDPYEIYTWDDFLVVCEQIKEAGKTPIGMWGKDPRAFSQFLDEMANPFYVTSATNDYTEELQNGSFDWTLWNNISQVLVELSTSGYLNVDVLTADPDSVKQEMAKGNVAFVFTGNSVIQGALEYNPDVEYGFIPLPAIHEDDSRQLVGGEREAIGVWKDGENIEEALMFIEFMARPESVARVCEARGNAPAITGVDVDLGMLTGDFNKYAEEGVAIYPYFDRVMLPSGMWSTMQDVGAGLVAGTYSLEEASKVMEDDYNRLRD